MSDWKGLAQAIRSRLDSIGIELAWYEIAEITDVVEMWMRQQSPMTQGLEGVPALIVDNHWYHRRNAALLKANAYLKAKNSKALKHNTELENRLRWFGNRVRRDVAYVLEASRVKEIE